MQRLKTTEKDLEKAEASPFLAKSGLYSHGKEHGERSSDCKAAQLCK
jgi:hypothetical protein